MGAFYSHLEGGTGLIGKSGMIVYTFKIAFQELIRTRETTFINVFGLFLGWRTLSLY